MTMNLDLPDEVLDRAEFPPAEDFVVYALRRAMPSIPAFTLIPEDIPENFVLVRKDQPAGYFQTDERHTWWSWIAIHVYTADPDGDEKGALISEAIRVALRDAWLEHLEVPGMGWFSKVRLTTEPARVTDWATAQGPVQYADLPTRYWRYESGYHIKLRRSLTHPYPRMGV